MKRHDQSGLRKRIPVKKIDFDYGDEKRVASMRYIVFQL